MENKQWKYNYPVSIRHIFILEIGGVKFHFWQLRTLVKEVAIVIIRAQILRTRQGQEK